MPAKKKPPLYIFPIWVFLLDGAAQSPRPLLRFTPGYAAVRRRNDLATARAAEGNPSRGVPPGPLPPFAHKGHPPKGCGFASLSSQLLRAYALFVSDSIARHWCSLVPRYAPLRRCNLRLVATDRRPEFSLVDLIRMCHRKPWEAPVRHFYGFCESLGYFFVLYRYTSCLPAWTGQAAHPGSVHNSSH